MHLECLTQCLVCDKLSVHFCIGSLNLDKEQSRLGISTTNVLCNFKSLCQTITLFLQLRNESDIVIVCKSVKI